MLLLDCKTAFKFHTAPQNNIQISHRQRCRAEQRRDVVTRLQNSIQISHCTAKQHSNFTPSTLPCRAATGCCYLTAKQHSNFTPHRKTTFKFHTVNVAVPSSDGMLLLDCKTAFKFHTAPLNNIQISHSQRCRAEQQRDVVTRRQNSIQISHCTAKQHSNFTLSTLPCPAATGCCYSTAKQHSNFTLHHKTTFQFYTAPQNNNQISHH